MYRNNLFISEVNVIFCLLRTFLKYIYIYNLYKKRSISVFIAANDVRNDVLVLISIWLFIRADELIWPGVNRNHGVTPWVVRPKSRLCLVLTAIKHLKPERNTETNRIVLSTRASSQCAYSFKFLTFSDLISLHNALLSKYVFPWLTLWMPVDFNTRNSIIRY